MYIVRHGKYPLFLSDFNTTWIFFTYFGKITQMSDFIKIPPVGTELFHADGRTDRWADRNDEDNGLFSKFWERAWKPMLKVTGKHSCFQVLEYEAQILITARRHRYQLLKRTFMSNFDCKLIKVHRIFLI
jgi:hypothetical protein